MDEQLVTVTVGAHEYSGGTLRDAVALAVLMAPLDEPDATTATHDGRELPLPEVTVEQRVECAIRCAQGCPGLPEAWITWAGGWLDGSDRSGEAAGEAWVAVLDVAWEAADAAAAAAEWYAAEWYAAWAAVWAADDAVRVGVDVAAIAGQVLLPDWQDNEEAEDGE